MNQAGGKAAQKERLTRESWLREGLRALAEQGEPAVKIDVIARRMQITRGSFYWHFEDRPAFLSALLVEWRRNTTLDFHALLERHALTAEEKLRVLLRITATGSDPRIPGGPLERAIAQWAMYSSEAATMMAEVQAERLRFIEGIFREMGRKRPKLLAEALYSQLVGRNQINVHAQTPLAEISLEALRQAAAEFHDVWTRLDRPRGG